MELIKTYFKGIFALFILHAFVATSMFLFNSCKKTESEAGINTQANNKFMAALNLSKKNIISMPLEYQLGKKTPSGLSERKAATKEDNEMIEMYVNLPSEVNDETLDLLKNTKSIEDISNLMYKTGATLQYQPTSTNSNYLVNVPVKEIEASLNPLVEDAKQYLQTKGFAKNEIQNMVKEENAEEVDLIPLVMVIVESENNQKTAFNHLNLFPIEALQAKKMEWSDVGHCAAHVIGVDILFSLGSSAAVTWSRAAIKKAFKTAAKKALGPIGVAIAVANFGFCLGGIEI